MCEFCTQHGEGKKWYLQAKNYEREVDDAVERKGAAADFIEKREEREVYLFAQSDKLFASDVSTAKATIAASRKNFNKTLQIVPIEDAEQILDMSSSIVRLDCFCRKIRGVHNARFCFGINTGQKYLELVGEYPDYCGKYEKLSKEEAKKLFRQFERDGLVHMVFAQTVFIETICNCDAVYCDALQIRSRNWNNWFLKAEYVSTIDWERCNGCRECMKLCNFGAISYSPAVKKSYIDQFKCYGCGLCRSACLPNAITLRDRNAIPVLAKEW